MSHAISDMILPPPDVDAAARPWPLVRAGIAAIALLVLALLLWSALAPLSAAVIGPGHVKVDMNRKVVQHQEGGIVAEILVRDGSRVEAGQTLIVLRDARVGAGFDLLRTQLDAELARTARLAAEQASATTPAFAAELDERSGDPRVAPLLERERSLFAVRRAALANQLALIDTQIREARTEVQARRSQLQADDTALALLRDELDANRSLADRGYVSRTRLVTQQRALAESTSRRAENQAELARAQQRISDLQLRAEGLRNQFQQEAAAELRIATATVLDLRERLRPAQDAEDRQRIVAPVAGEVVDLRVSSIGGVIAPREPILDIVPADAALVVEARIRPEDINQVYPGATADVRLTGLRQRLTPTVKGEVRYVSADRLLDKAKDSPYYTVHVQVSPEALARAGALRLQPGMPAEVFIRSEARSALEYLLDPVLGFLLRSMREQ